VRSTEFRRDLGNVARAAVCKEIERRNLGERKIRRRQLLRSGEDELTPEPANRDDATADLSETLSTPRHLIDSAAEWRAANASDSAPQFIGSTREVG
jgi:hypothetical protein